VGSSFATAGSPSRNPATPMGGAGRLTRDDTAADGTVAPTAEWFALPRTPTRGSATDELEAPTADGLGT